MRAILGFGALAAVVVLCGACDLGRYESDFPVVIENRTDAFAITVFANASAIGTLNPGQLRSFSVRLQESNSNTFAGGIAPTPQAFATFAGRDQFGHLSPGLSLQVSKNGLTYIEFFQGADERACTLCIGQPPAGGK